LYCEIWREPPWLEFHFTPEGVTANILDDMARPNALAFLAMRGGEVLGFTWGYEVSREMAREIASNDGLDSLFLNAGTSRRFFYIDELGVSSQARRMHLGELLSGAIMDAARDLGITNFLLRTDRKAFPARNLYRKIGFRELSVQDGKHKNRTFWAAVSTEGEKCSRAWV
jgi:ribosomal protein S18 acetylase RimI-like enzyme